MPLHIVITCNTFVLRIYVTGKEKESVLETQPFSSRLPQFPPGPETGHGATAGGREHVVEMTRSAAVWHLPVLGDNNGLDEPDEMFVHILL
jgi:hypothetical protein